MSPSVCDHFAAHCRLRDLDDGEALYRRGDIDRNLYLLSRGSLMLWIAAGHGEERPIHLLQKGAWLASPFTLTGDPRLVTLSSSGTSEVLFVDGDDFDHLIERHGGEMWRWVARLAAHNQGMSYEIIRDLLADGALSRIAGRLASMSRSGDTLELSQVQLGQITGLSRNTVQRVLGTLEARGIVRTGYRRLTVLDRRELEVLAASAQPPAGEPDPAPRPVTARTRADRRTGR